jgi:hypothetical protein
VNVLHRCDSVSVMQLCSRLQHFSCGQDDTHQNMCGSITQVSVLFMFTLLRISFAHFMSVVNGFHTGQNMDPTLS